MRLAWRALPIAALVLVTVLAAGAAADDLVADAGASRAAEVDPVVPVDGAVHGAPADGVTVNWSLEDRPGSWSRFQDPEALETRLNTTGLPPGDVTLNLTVTDPQAGETAWDTVVYRVVEVQSLLEVTDRAGPGAPDEFVGLSGADGQTKTYEFTVPAGTDGIVATLDWDGENAPPLFGNDFDLRLLDTSGEDVTGRQGASPDKPERVSVDDPEAGTWTAQVEAWLAGRDTIHLDVRTDPDPLLPGASIKGPLDFGAEDTQEILAKASSPTGFDELAWDLDADGHADADAGLRSDGLYNVTADLPGGTHDVILRGVTPDHGYEVRSVAGVTVHDVDTALWFGCGGKAWRPQWAMEYNLSKGSCWMHGGKHTYYLGAPHTLEGGSGKVFSVEQQLSPPREADADTETDVDTTGGDDPLLRVGADVDAPVRIEVSPHGDEWTTVGVASYDVASTSVSNQRITLGFQTRQSVSFTLSEHDEAFRYVRIHQPRSTAEGLSGFLDRSKGVLLMEEAQATPSTPAEPVEPTTLDCRDGDHLEDFFPAHPCTYGGANRYDAPSFSHTYPLGEVGLVSEIDVDATVAPWRSDDFFLLLLPTLDQVQGTTLHVETSLDGREWTTHARADVTYGVPANVSVDLGDQPARFVRVHAGYHPFYDQAGQFPSLHHPDGFLVDSTVEVR